MIYPIQIRKQRDLLDTKSKVWGQVLIRDHKFKSSRTYDTLCNSKYSSAIIDTCTKKSTF